MRIHLKVKPGATRNNVTKNEDGSFVISVTASPEKGKANKAIIGTLADCLGIAKSKISIISGLSSKNKIVEIVGDVVSRNI